MNHRRQQALGNIGAMLQRGAKVYLDERNVVYQFLKKRGAHVFSTIDFTKSQGHLFEPLDEFKVLQNREVLEAFWGDDIVRKNAMCFIDRIEKYRLAKLTERKR
jgi:dTDP-N-acetylfucosamine:lipid II N-acetylfucosaminyltransferase